MPVLGDLAQQCSFLTDQAGVENKSIQLWFNLCYLELAGCALGWDEQVFGTGISSYYLWSPEQDWSSWVLQESSPGPGAAGAVHLWGLSPRAVQMGPNLMAGGRKTGCKGARLGLGLWPWLLLFPSLTKVKETGLSCPCLQCKWGHIKQC